MKPDNRSLEQSVEIETPEQVAFAYTVAGLGSRSAAALIDYLICIAIVIGVLFLGTMTAATFPGPTSMLAEEFVMVLILLTFFAVFWGYYVLFEGLRDGQTPGKRAMSLRVVQDGGFSVSFAASAVRNLVRIVDMLPGVYAVGMTSVILSKTGKRLGDFAAGTIVVQERVVAAPVATSARAKEEVASATAAPLTAQLSDEEYALLERYLARRASLDAARQAEFDYKLITRLRDRIPNDKNEPVSILLPRMYEQEKQLRARGVASRSDTGAAREQHSIVAAGAEKWSEFGKKLSSARGGGLRKMSEDQVADLVMQYREVSTDLARLRTASRGRMTDSVFYLSRLVARGHNLLYRQRQLVPLIVWNFIAVAIPRELRKSASYILLAALLFFGPMVAAHIAVVRDPSLALKLVGPDMVDRAETALERERRGGAYLPEPLARSRGAVLATRLATNNVQVTYMAFALGMTAAVGTLYVLLLNGVFLGAGLGVFQNHSALHLIVAFVAPHGVLELTAICIAGGAGFLIGSAMLLPGAMTRREAMVIRGRRAIRLIAGASLFLVVAGLIEGYISPIGLKLMPAFAISAATAVLAILYFSAGRGSDHDTSLSDEEFGYSDARALSSR